METSSTPTPPAPTTEPSLVNQPPAVAEPAAFVPLEASAFTMPEGFALDDESMTGFLGIMNNRELSPQEQAQALIELQAGITTKSSEAGSQAWNDQQQAWQQEVAAHPTLGGDNLPKTLESVGRLMDKYATPEIREAFDKTGAGNHPAVVGFLHALSAALSESKPAAPGAPVGQSAATSLATTMYPNQGKTQ